MMEIKNAIASLAEYIEGCYSQPSLQHTHLAGAGATFHLEEKLRNYYSKKFAVTFSSATMALQAVCLAMELQDTEILTTPINWGGSIAPFLLHRNKLRFASVDSASLNLSLSDLPSAITHKTKAVLSVDYNGTPTDSKTIKNFCESHGLKYISDSAQSLGACRNKKPAGFFADTIVLSFSPGKSFFAGEGGAVITDDENLFEKLIWYSQHPSKQKTVFGISSYNEYAPLNGKINPLSAILLNETFESSLTALKKYQEKCFQLLTQLQTEKLIESTPHITSPEQSTYFNFSLQLKESVSLQQVNDYLKHQKHSFTAIHSIQKVIPFDPSFRKQFRDKFSCSENLQKQKSSNQLNDQITLVHSPYNNQT